MRWHIALTLAGIVSIPALSSDRVTADDLAGRLLPLIEAHEGKVAVAVRPLAGGEAFSHRAEIPMPSASLIKFPVMIEAYRQAEAGRVDLQKRLTLKDSDKVPGSGILTDHFSEGTVLSLRDAIRLMIAFSDNTATNLVLAEIGLGATAAAMHDMGFPETKIHSLVYRRETSLFPERSREFGLGSTTAADMVALLARLHARTLVSPAASDAMRAHLLACDDRLKFTRLLPAGTKVAHKTGSVDRSRTAAGIIETNAGPVALCVLTSENRDTRWSNDNAGDLLCAEIARAVYDHFAGRREPQPQSPSCGEPEAESPLGSPAPGGAARPADESRIVPAAVEDAEAVEDQRDAAVEVFPAGATSVADGSLLPRDSLEGPPFVSCRHWAVADAKSGALLGDLGAGDTVDVASTTKIMTAHVILSVAAKNPKVLDERVTFSERAAKTAGSSCDLRPGESLPVREMLYALLLPSGNDAATALAEHFGPRFEPARKGSGDAVARFVAEMNREARRLGMTATKYANPNGLPEKGHMSSARDLVRVTLAARKHPLFREIVATRRKSAEVQTRDGQTRDVTWKSTNRLLGITGYSGVKTGYTKAAGSCLVSTGERQGETLLVVVLGAPSTSAAVADSRNLYRWAWRTRGVRE